MNEQHKLNRLKNRARRIARKIPGLQAAKVGEVVRASKANREPNTAPYDVQIARLQDRARQLQP